MLMFMETYDGTGFVRLYAASPSGRQVEVLVETKSGLHGTFKVDSQGDSYTLASSYRSSGMSVSDKGIRVSAPEDIVLFALNRGNGHCGAMMAIPVDALANEYYTMVWWTYTNTGVRYSEIGALAVEDNTMIRFILKDNRGIRIEFNGLTYRDGEIIQVILNRYETIQLQEYQYSDLTGTKVLSDKPIAVFSGNRIVSISSNYGDADDHVIEQMPPVVTYGKNYIVIPIPGRAGGTKIKFLTRDAQTTIRISHSDGGSEDILLYTAGDFDERTVTANDYVILTSNKFFLVTQFMESENPADYGAPTMINVPPVQQYRNWYQFTTPGDVTYQTYLMLIVDYTYSSDMLIDGSRVNADGWTPVPGTNYVGQAVSLTRALSHSVYHSSQSVRFGAYLYSVASNDCAYGYSVGSCLEDLRGVCTYFIFSFFYYLFLYYLFLLYVYF